MGLNNIEKLLEKYENGEKTLNEEQQLKNYFSEETVMPHLEMYKPMFAYFKVSKQEQFTKALPLKTKKVLICNNGFVKSFMENPHNAAARPIKSGI